MPCDLLIGHQTSFFRSDALADACLVEKKREMDAGRRQRSASAGVDDGLGVDVPGRTPATPPSHQSNRTARRRRAPSSDKLLIS